jgi:Fe-S-cluster containining protein
MTPAQFNTRTDSIMAYLLGLPGALKPCCSKGCSHCCYEPAYSDSRQIDHIIEGMSADQIEYVKVQLSAWLEATKEIRKIQRPGAHEYRDLVIPCPLLRNGLCSAYERRPVDCRIWFAIGHPDDCAMPARKHQKFADYPMETKTEIIWPFFEAGIEVNGEVHLDHIGVLLAERLLGIEVESAARQRIKAQ